MPSEPIEFYQAHLDVCTAAYLDDDYQTLRQHIGVPAFITSRDEERWIETPDEMERCLRTSRASLRDMGANGYIRVCRDASFEGTGTDRIVGEHETFILRGAERVIPPYRSIVMLELTNGLWVSRGIACDVSCRDYSLISPEQSGDMAAAPE